MIQKVQGVAIGLQSDVYDFMSIVALNLSKLPLKAPIPQTFFCWKTECVCLCVWFQGHDFETTENNSNFIACRPAVRNTCNIKVAQLKFIKESYVQTEELCWWHPLYSLECHLHLPKRGLRRMTKKPQLTDARVKLHKRRGLTANSFWDFTCTFHRWNPTVQPIQ